MRKVLFWCVWLFFTAKETEAQFLNNLPQITQQSLADLEFKSKQPGPRANHYFYTFLILNQVASLPTQEK